MINHSTFLLRFTCLLQSLRSPRTPRLSCCRLACVPWSDGRVDEGVQWNCRLAIGESVCSWELRDRLCYSFDIGPAGAGNAGFGKSGAEEHAYANRRAEKRACRRRVKTVPKRNCRVMPQRRSLNLNELGAEIPTFRCSLSPPTKSSALH